MSENLLSERVEQSLQEHQPEGAVLSALVVVAEWVYGDGRTALTTMRDEDLSAWKAHGMLAYGQDLVEPESWAEDE